LPLDTIEEESSDSALVKIYSDRLGIKGMIGALAVLYQYANSCTTKSSL
jgi:hypothetical protein